MPQETVRCPYCVLGDEFRPMFRRSKKYFVCLSCGHTAPAADPYAKCGCTRCQKVTRVASQCRSSQEVRKASAAM